MYIIKRKVSFGNGCIETTYFTAIDLSATHWSDKPTDAKQYANKSAAQLVLNALIERDYKKASFEIIESN